MSSTWILEIDEAKVHHSPHSTHRRQSRFVYSSFSYTLMCFVQSPLHVGILLSRLDVKMNMGSTAERNHCPSCGECTLSGNERAIVAPWIRDLANISKRFTKLNRCSTCSSAWFTLNYSSDELTRIYSEYREEAYVSHRHHWESYTLSINDVLDEESHYQESRRTLISALLERELGFDISSCETVVDYAGAHGIVIEKWIGINNRFVIEISNTSVLPGIQKAATILDIPFPINAILFLGVLEHLPHPDEFLRARIKEVIRHQSQFSQAAPKPVFIFEVPNGVPAKRTQLCFILCSIASFWPKAWRFVCKSPAFRRYIGSPLRVAEHLQFYSDIGIEKLLERVGLNLIVSETYNLGRELSDLNFSRSNMVIASLK